jgi:hypothetical protein
VSVGLAETQAFYMIQHSEGSVHLVYETPLGIGHKFPFNELLNGGLDERIHCSKSLKIQQDESVNDGQTTDGQGDCNIAPSLRVGV